MSQTQSNRNLMQNGRNYVLRPNYQKAKIKNLREQSPFQNGKRNKEFINPSLTSNMIFYNQKDSTISNPHMVKKANMPRGYNLNNYVVTDLEVRREEKFIPVTESGKKSQYRKSRINLKKTMKRNVSTSQRSLHRSRSKNSINNVSRRKEKVVKKSQRSISRNRSMKRNKSDNNISYSKSKIEEDLISQKSKKSGLSKRSKKSNLSKAKERLLKKKKKNDYNDLIKLNNQNNRTKYEEYLGKDKKKANIQKIQSSRENSRYQNNPNHHQDHSHHYHNDGHLQTHKQGHSHHHHQEDRISLENGHNHGRGQIHLQEGYSEREGYNEENGRNYGKGRVHGQEGYSEENGRNYGEGRVHGQEGYSEENGRNYGGGRVHGQEGYSEENGRNYGGGRVHGQEGYSEREGYSRENGGDHGNCDGHSHSGHDEGFRKIKRNGGKTVSRGNSEFTGVSGSNVSDPSNLICDKCINQKIYKDKLMNLEEQRLMDEDFANRVNENLRLQLQREKEENEMKKKIYNEAINNQIEDLKRKKRQKKAEEEEEDNKIRHIYENNQSELNRVAEEKRKKNNFIKDLKNQINKKREIEFLKREEEYQIDKETPNVLIDDGFRYNQREAMKEYYKNNLINQIIEKEEEKEGLKKRKIVEDEEYRLELDKIRREENQKRLNLELQKKKIFLNEINKQLKDNNNKKEYQNELNRRGDEDYWKKIDHDQKVYMENMFKKKQMMNGYIQNLGDQMVRDKEKKKMSLYERKKKTNTTLCMGKKPSKCYNCVVCRARYPLKMLNKKKRYKKK